MNIFFLDKNPSIAARKQVNKSATKMVLESAQLLSDAVRTYGYEGNFVYKGAYHNHPSTKWVRKSRQHFNWVLLHALELCEYYTDTYGKIHKSQEIIEYCIDLIDLIPNKGFAITYKDLAIQSTPTGIKAYNNFLESNQTFDDVVIAYTSFYNAKEYVIKAKQ